jgi:hypothetical protein
LAQITSNEFFETPDPTMIGFIVVVIPSSWMALR